MNKGLRAFSLYIIEGVLEMEFNLKMGMIGEKEDTVDKSKLATSYGSGGVEVYATPAMVGLMENAALNCVDPVLPEGWATVGMSLDIKHLAATPIGDTVKARAELINIEGRKLSFKIEAYDSKEKIGEGLHNRYIIDLAKFIAKCEEKKK